MYIVRSDLWWRIGNRVVMDPTVEELLSLTVGDAAYANPPRAKSDQTGEIHCPFPVCFPFNHETDNAAAALCDIELRCPCHGTDRQTRPVIADEAGNPFTHSVLDRILHNVQSSEFILVKNDKLTRKALTEPLPANDLWWSREVCQGG